MEKSICRCKLCYRVVNLWYSLCGCGLLFKKCQNFCECTSRLVVTFSKSNVSQLVEWQGTAIPSLITCGKTPICESIHVSIKSILVWACIKQKEGGTTTSPTSRLYACFDESGLFFWSAATFPVYTYECTPYYLPMYSHKFL